LRALGTRLEQRFSIQDRADAARDILAQPLAEIMRDGVMGDLDHRLPPFEKDHSMKAR
jgi:hypothetical protein